MHLILDGNDWEADYFTSLARHKAWRNDPRRQSDMLMECVSLSDFIRPDAAPGDRLRGTIPGCDRTFLLENGLCDDPYFGRNLDRTRWAEHHAWAFRKRFVLPESWRRCRRIILKFRGLDYEACVFLNGEGVGCHKGMFIPAEFDVTDMLRPGGENLLAVGFEPMPQASPDHRDSEAAEFAGFHRMQMSYGWDWARGMAAAAIWDSVELIGYETARVRDCRAVAGTDAVTLELELESRTETVLPLEVAVTPENFSGPGGRLRTELPLEPGPNARSVAVPVPELHRWYPVGCGRPDLYRITVKFDGNVTEFVTGFKDLVMRRNPDSPEGAYPLTFVLNGREVFARGLNYVPADLMFARNTAADYDRLARLAAEGGFNLFRVWGGGMVEKDAFYAACDRHGIMVWQEFMHACSNYPKDAEYLAFKKREGEAILRKIRNFASLVMLCGGNEMQYYGEIPDSPLLLQYGELAARFAPGIPYHVSCPDLSRPGERNHGPWTFQEHHVYNRHRRRLASEVGCNGMPEFSSLRKFIPESEIAAGKGQSLRYHFFNDVDGDRRNLRLPLEKFACADMEQFCQASMFAQADACAYVMEHYRRLSPLASGCFIWQYNEPWPTCAYSIVDYYSVPKMAYYALKKANAPILVSLADESWCVDVTGFSARAFVTCDRECAGLAEAELFDCFGRSILRRSVRNSWPEGTTEVLDFHRESVPDGILLVRLKFTGNDDRTHFVNTRLYGVPDFRSAFALPPTRVSATVAAAGDGRATVTVANRGPAAAVNVRIALPEFSECEVFFSDNFLTLLPGEQADVAVGIPSGRAVTEVRLRGWNC